MQIRDLPGIEREAIDLLLQGEGAVRVLHRQLDAVTRVHRTESGAGLYVVFELAKQVERLEDGASFHIADVFATSQKCEEIGFILFVKDGLIEYLEGYSYSDVYPSYEGCDFSLSRHAP